MINFQLAFFIDFSGCEWVLKCIFKKSVIFLVRFNFLFCVEDHHSPLESDLTRSFCTADRHLPLENDMEVYVQFYLFWSLQVRRFWFGQKWQKFFGNRFQTVFFLSKERIKFPYKNPYISIFIIFVDFDEIWKNVYSSSSNKGVIKK